MGDLAYIPGDVTSPATVLFPPYLVAGDSWTFQLPAGNYGDGSWTATATFANATQNISQPAVLSGDYFQWTVPGSATEAILPGPLAYSIYVSDQVNRYTLQVGAVNVITDISQSAPINTLSMLQACQQTLLKILNKQVSMITFGGKQYSLHNIKDLWAVQQSLFARVAQEQERLSGNRRNRMIAIRFTRI
jgi:hypothetical protein